MRYIDKLLKIAEKSSKRSEVPVAAMILKNEKILCYATNTKEKTHDITAHAEIKCLKRAAKKLKRWNLNDCIMIVTLKPCKMCETVIKEAHLSTVYYLLDKLDYKHGYSKTNFIKLNNMQTDEGKYKKLLTDFFKNKRKK